MANVENRWTVCDKEGWIEDTYNDKFEGAILIGFNSEEEGCRVITRMHGEFDARHVASAIAYVCREQFSNPILKAAAVEILKKEFIGVEQNREMDLLLDMIGLL